MRFLNVVTALWIVSRAVVAIPIDARYAIEQRGSDHRSITPKVFIIDMVG